ncbi:hypothetical protein D3C75_465440 [compost metagenome]
MTVLKNVSDSNIVIEKQAVIPGDTIEIPSECVQKYQKLIDIGMIKQEHNIVKRVDKTYSLSEEKEKEYNELKQRLTPAFFALHINQNLDEQQLEDLKWFYKNVGPTSSVDISIKMLIDDARDTEEFIEIVLNHLYPELIKLYFDKLEK